ncbi:MAG TPA: hypothetical protein VGK48_24855 [Terriglobia bacterium]|jgi:hypothetical protein
MRTFLALVCLLQPFLLQQARAQGSDPAAYTQIVKEKNPETKKKLALNFEKNFPKSKRLPEVYIELSRALANESDFGTARVYADKALATVTKMKTQPAPEEYTNATWHQWLGTVENSAKTNLAWVNQMVTWQQQQLRSMRGQR